MINGFATFKNMLTHKNVMQNMNLDVLAQVRALDVNTLILKVVARQYGNLLKDK